MVVDVSKRCRRWCKASILTHMLMLMVTLVLMVCPAVAEIQCELCKDSTTHTFLLVLNFFHFTQLFQLV